MTESEAQDYPVLPQGPPVDPDRQDRTRVRERILRRFELWLDEILDGEPPIEGLAAEVLEQLQAETSTEQASQPGAGCDLYALWSVVTAMTEETRLQGRAFKQLRDGLAPMEELVGSLGATLQRHEATLGRQEQRIDEQSKRAAWMDVLETLIDMRDRLIRGAESARAWLEPSQPVRESGLVRRICGRFSAPAVDTRMHQYEEAVRSLLKGYGLCQEVLDEALARIGVHCMDCLDRPFDPVMMKAVDIAHESDAPDGTVVEVYRQGYWWGETVYRPAEVKVARGGPGTQQGEPGMMPGQEGAHES